MPFSGQDDGVPPSGSGRSPKGGAAKASPAKPSVPNAEQMARMWDKDVGAAFISAVPPEYAAHALDAYRALENAPRGWSKRAALISTVGMLRKRFGHAHCDSDGVADCARCNIMFLVRTTEATLAAIAMEAATAGETERLDPKGDSAAIAQGDANV